MAARWSTRRSRRRRLASVARDLGRYTKATRLEGSVDEWGMAGLQGQPLLLEYRIQREDCVRWSSSRVADRLARAGPPRPSRT